MGISNGDFVKYPRTPHLYGSVGTADDKHLDKRNSDAFIADESLVVEEKLDGTNVGIHFNEVGELILQSRGHLITDGMHPQYDLFKQWAICKRQMLQQMLGVEFIMFGEWVYAQHSIRYRKLSHFFYEFDIWNKSQQQFLTLERRLQMLKGSGIETVPVLHRGSISRKLLQKLIGASCFDSAFDNPFTNQADNLMEGLYLRTEADGIVTGRSKIVRPEFVEKIKQSTHWQHRTMVANQLSEDADIWR